MAATNGYTPMQSSSLYITDGDEIDWAYGHEGIFMYTFEMYPSHSQVSSNARFYPPDEQIGPQTERNKAAVLMLMEAAACPYQWSGRARQDCGPFYDDFETPGGWTVNPYGTDKATAGRWERADPQATSVQSGFAPSGSRALVTGHLAGSKPSSYDLDGGVTTVRSPGIALPASPGRLYFRYTFSHASNSSSADYFRAFVEDQAGHRRLVLAVNGSARTVGPSWKTASIPMASWAGQTVRIVFQASDGGKASTVEAAVDDVRVTRP